MKDQNLKEYTDLNFIKKEVEDSKNLFKKNNWPIIDVTRRFRGNRGLNIKDYRD